MKEKTKSIEIVLSPDDKGVSITIGNKTITNSEKAINMHIVKELGYAYLLIDCSGSMSGDKLDQAKNGAIGFAKDAILKRYYVGLISFADTAIHVCQPVNNARTIELKLANMDIDGGTNMFDAIVMAHKQLKSVKGMRAIVVATDGQPNDATETLRVGQLAKDDGIDLITIGTDDADQSFLKSLASRSDLATRVSKESFGEAITSASNLLQLPQ